MRRVGCLRLRPLHIHVPQVHQDRDQGHRELRWPRPDRRGLVGLLPVRQDPCWSWGRGLHRGRLHLRLPPGSQLQLGGGQRQVRGTALSVRAARRPSINSEGPVVSRLRAARRPWAPQPARVRWFRGSVPRGGLRTSTSDGPVVSRLGPRGGLRTSTSEGPVVSQARAARRPSHLNQRGSGGFEARAARRPSHLNQRGSGGFEARAARRPSHLNQRGSGGFEARAARRPSHLNQRANGSRDARGRRGRPGGCTGRGRRSGRSTPSPGGRTAATCRRSRTRRRGRGSGRRSRRGSCRRP